MNRNFYGHFLIQEQREVDQKSKIENSGLTIERKKWFEED